MLVKCNQIYFSFWQISLFDLWVLLLHLVVVFWANGASTVWTCLCWTLIKMLRKRSSIHHSLVNHCVAAGTCKWRRGSTLCANEIVIELINEGMKCHVSVVWHVVVMNSIVRCPHEELHNQTAGPSVMAAFVTQPCDLVVAISTSHKLVTGLRNHWTWQWD